MLGFGTIPNILHDVFANTSKSDKPPNLKSCWSPVFWLSDSQPAVWTRARGSHPGCRIPKSIRAPWVLLGLGEEWSNWLSVGVSCHLAQVWGPGKCAFSRTLNSVNQGGPAPRPATLLCVLQLGVGPPAGAAPEDWCVVASRYLWAQSISASCPHSAAPWCSIAGGLHSRLSGLSK